MSTAQEVRNYFYSYDKAKRARELGTYYFDYVIDLIEALRRTTPEESYKGKDVVVTFTFSQDSDVEVLINPKLGDAQYEGKPKTGRIEIEADLEGFRHMEKMFKLERGFSAEIIKKQNDNNVYEVIVTMHHP